MAPIEPGLDDAIVPALAEQVRIREERGPGRGLGLGRGARDADMTDAGDVPEANRDTRTVRMDEGGGGGGEGEEDGDDVLDSQEDGVLRDFRRGLATEEDVKEFPRMCKDMSDDALGEYLHTLKAAVVDCPVVEILCDVFELGPEDPDGMSPGERHAACWQKVDTADDVNDLCKSVETRMVCATGKIFNLIAEVEERRGQGLEVWMDTLFFAHSRVFSLREAVCSVVEARVPKKVRENLPRLTVRLSSGAGELKEIAPSARTRSPWGGVSAAGPQLSVRGRCELANDVLCELGIRRFATTDDVLELGNGLLLGLLTLWLIRRGADSS
eukprot:jgi/Mesvir1/14432/Mv05162-RA.1